MLTEVQGSNRAEPSRQNQAVLVLGMHRSGTSMTAGVLHHLGVSFGSNRMAPAEQNPKGFFEDLAIVALHDELLAALNSRWDDPRPLPPNWAQDPRMAAFAARLEPIIRAGFADRALYGIKDPRLCRLLPLWLPLLARLDIRPRFLLAVRHPGAVALSLRKRNAMDPNYAGILWLQHVMQSEAITRGESRLVVEYTRLIEDWRSVVAAMGEFLHQDWTQLPESTAGKLQEFVSPELRHHAVGDFTMFEPQLAKALEQAYRALLTSSPAELPASMDDVQARIDGCERYGLAAYGPAIDRLQHELRAHQLELQRIKRAWSYQAMSPFRAIGRAMRGQRI